MYATYYPGYSTKSIWCDAEKISENKNSENNNSDKLLNAKIYYLNKSTSKFISVGIGLNDFLPKITIGGQNGFKVCLNEEEWNNFLNYQGVLVSYFYAFDGDTTPLKIGNITIYFEKYNQHPILKVQNGDGCYVCLGCDSMDKLWEIKEIIDYRIGMIKRQDFVQYFNVLKPNIHHSESMLATIYNVINPKQSRNSENVCTALELLKLYPNELVKKLSYESSKRRYYEEISENK